MATTTFNIINGNGDTKLIQREGNQNTTIMYLIESNRTFFIMKSNKGGTFCRSKTGNIFKDHNMTILVGVPNATSNASCASFPRKEGSYIIAGRNFSRFASEDAISNERSILVDTKECRPLSMESNEYSSIFYDYQVGGDLPASTWILPKECYKEDVGKETNDSIFGTVLKGLLK